jgi:hypothetical protein
MHFFTCTWCPGPIFLKDICAKIKNQRKVQTRSASKRPASKRPASQARKLACQRRKGMDKRIVMIKYIIIPSFTAGISGAWIEASKRARPGLRIEVTRAR